VPGCADTSGPQASVVEVSRIYGQKLIVEDVRFRGPGLRVTTGPGTGPVRVDVTMRRSRCTSAYDCRDLLNLDLYGPFPSGSSVQVLAENNLISSTQPGALRFFGLSLAPADAANSAVKIVNNTIYAESELDHAVRFATSPDLPVGNFTNPLLGTPGNASLGDFRPSAGSPLRGAADARFLPRDDLNRGARVSRDIGALRFESAP
jgi:hypothetical protein